MAKVKAMKGKGKASEKAVKAVKAPVPSPKQLVVMSKLFAEGRVASQELDGRALRALSSKQYIEEFTVKGAYFTRLTTLGKRVAKASMPEAAPVPATAAAPSATEPAAAPA